MRAAIVTLYNNNLNYGALLQAYALKNTVEKLGYEASVVDYPFMKSEARFQKRSLGWRHLVNPKKLAGYILYLSFLGEKDERIRKTEKFSKECLNVTPLCRTSEDIDNLNFDVHICGSDQIWNPKLTDGLKVAFFGGEGRAYKIAYAASAGELDALKKCQEQFIELLEKMDAVSVRENDLYNYIKSNTNHDVIHVLDPTLLLQKEDYKNILKRPVGVKPYLLVYSLDRNIGMLKIAHSIAKEKSLQVIEIGITRTPFCGHKQIFSADPLEFLGWLEQASFVVTNSFHGTAFSIQFNRNFLVIKHKTQGARMESLLDKLKLHDRLIENPNNFKYENIQGIKYQNVDETLSELRKDSLDFLRHALSSNAE